MAVIGKELLLRYDYSTVLATSFFFFFFSSVIYLPEDLVRRSI